jgi:signal transduction histidine kinase
VIFHAGASLEMDMPSIRSNSSHARPQASMEDHDAPSMSEKDIMERRIARLEERIEELDAFASSVSHDLRAPLRTVHGYARILEEEHAGELTAAGPRVRLENRARHPGDGARDRGSPGALPRRPRAGDDGAGQRPRAGGPGVEAS